MSAFFGSGDDVSEEVVSKVTVLGSCPGVVARLGILNGREVGKTGVCGLLDAAISSFPGDRFLKDAAKFKKPSEYFGGDFGDSIVTCGAVLVGDNGPMESGLGFGVLGLEFPSVIDGMVL